MDDNSTETEMLSSELVFEDSEVEIDSAILRKRMMEEKNKTKRRATRDTTIGKKRLNKNKQWDLYVSKYSSQQKKNRKKKKSTRNHRMTSAHLRAHTLNTVTDSTENSENIFDFEQQSSNSCLISKVTDPSVQKVDSELAFEGLDVEIDSVVPLKKRMKGEKKRKKRRITSGTYNRKKKLYKKKHGDLCISKYSSQQRKNQIHKSTCNRRMKSAHVRACSFNTPADTIESAENIFDFDQQSSNSSPLSKDIDPSVQTLLSEPVVEGVEAGIDSVSPLRKHMKGEKKRKKRRTTRGTNVRKKVFNKKKQWDLYVSKYSSHQRKNQKNKSTCNRRMKSAHERACSFNTPADSTENIENIFDFDQQSINSSLLSKVIEQSVEKLNSELVFEDAEAGIDSVNSLRKHMNEEKNKKKRKTTRGTNVRKKVFNKKKQWDLYVSKYLSHQRKIRKKKSKRNRRMNSAHLRACSFNTSIASTESTENIFDFEQQCSNSSLMRRVFDSSNEELSET
ncbi:uncharacterized protein LOC119688337 [Teleopsis dalmanni]|uniref:uncharacterized protein LOC119688337 n=1 Tax=Teleopsis dalmanni TaxID=139649 RepID=UPI0018CDD9D8|nr:uncharacterized protein LOC119688337 [Teleopsis dalmanni]